MDVRTLPIPKRENHRPSKRTKREVQGNLSLTFRGHTTEASRRSQRRRYRETCRGNVDYRIQGLPHSTVQKEHSKRKEIVNRLIQQFENHPSRESLIEDLNKTEEFNPFSERSKELTTSMGNTEYFELCETSANMQCPQCALYWEAGIFFCTCGNCMQLTERNRQLNTARYDVLSITGYVIKKNPSHAARNGPSMRQCMYYKAHDMLRKARKHKSGGYKSILDRWHDDEKYRKSFSDVGWTEEQIIQYDEIALEDHSYVATWQERSRNEKSWKNFCECRRYSRAIESAQ